MGAEPPYVRATVVRAQHPSSAHAGDTAVLLPDGRLEGFVGGVCAESSVQLHGLQVLESGEPLLLRILPGAVETTAVEAGAVTVSNPCLSGGALEIFLEPRRPAPRVLVVGDTPTAHALTQLGEPLGLAVEFASDEIEPPSASDAALVVASHGRDEEHALETALNAGVPYVGLVASRVRGAAVLATLDVPADQKARVHSPAGLDIGARTPSEIALSILAEIIALRTPSLPPPAPATAVNPICGMTVPALDTTPHLDQDGQTLYFCSDHCRATYAAQL